MQSSIGVRHRTMSAPCGSCCSRNARRLHRGERHGPNGQGIRRVRPSRPQGFRMRAFVRQDPAGRHPATSPMVGDSAKLQRQTGWRAEISFEAMVSAMVSTQQRSLRAGHAVDERRSPKPSRVEINVASNLVGTALTVLIEPGVCPCLRQATGRSKSYGLVGFYATVLAALQVLDLGVSPTINRELARLSAIPGHAGRARDLVRTLEIPYWLLGLLIGALIAVMAPGDFQPLAPGLRASRGDRPIRDCAHGRLVRTAVAGQPLPGRPPGPAAIAPVECGERQFRGSPGVGRGARPAHVSSSILSSFVVATDCHRGAGDHAGRRVLWRSLPASPARAMVRWGELSTCWRFAASLTFHWRHRHHPDAGR